MNKTLLILAAAAFAVPAYGAIKTPVIYDNASFNGISNDGKYAVSQIYGTVVVYNLQDNSETAFEASDENYYTLGNGKSITADGSLIVGSTIEAGNAAYYEGGQWILLSVPDQQQTNVANGVTSDGKRICGNLGVHEMTISEDVLMQVPVYWDRKEDGTFGEPVRLPHPDTDLFGLTPQYITAVNLSDDGKIIVGQVQDCRGFMAYPIVFTQDDNGEWSYSIPTKDLFNPDNIPAAAPPADGPIMPTQEDFMTDAEKEAYQAALQAYYDSGYDQNLYPKYETFMTDEEKEAYKTAYDTWETEQAAWEAQFDAYNDFYYGALDSSPNFVFNNIFLTPDGKTFASSLMVEKENDDPMSYYPTMTVYTPVTVDVATGTLTKHESSTSMTASCITADGTILAATPLGTIPMEGFVIRNGETVSLTDYLTAISPEYGTWLKENMSHETIVGVDYDEDLDEWIEIYEDYAYTGITVSNPDMTVLAFWNDCPWDMMGIAQGVVIDMTTEAGISAVEADGDSNIALDADGNLTVGADIVSVAVYDLAGAMVASAQNPAGTVALGLNSGVYVVKAVRADGSTAVAKVAK